MKRVTLDPSIMSSDKLTVIEVMEVDSIQKLKDSEEYTGLEEKEFYRALIKNDSDWIYTGDKWAEAGFLPGQ